MDVTGADPFGEPYRRPRRGLDPIGWFIATTHSLLGHDKTAALLGQPPGDKGDCLICAYERRPTPESRQAVIDAIGRPHPEETR